MFKKFLKSKKKSTVVKKKFAKKTMQKKNVTKKNEISQFSTNKILTAEGWLRRHKKIF